MGRSASIALSLWRTRRRRSILAWGVSSGSEERVGLGDRILATASLRAEARPISKFWLGRQGGEKSYTLGWEVAR